jgi:tRNA (guanine37-N1)-methyltransferase
VLTINVVTLFPEVVRPYLAASIPARAQATGLVEYQVVDPREFATDRHRTVDDAPYGGGAGMVLRPEPLFAAVDSVPVRGRVVVMSARGTPLTHAGVVRYSLEPGLTVVCGHYKDIDQRVVDGLGADEVSVGDFVLSGGEPAALCLIDAVVRLLPGALGDHESASSDSFYDGLLSPEVLRSGNHAEIAAWRQQQAERLTAERRPDLWARYQALEEG